MIHVFLPNTNNFAVLIMWRIALGESGIAVALCQLPMPNLLSILATQVEICVKDTSRICPSGGNKLPTHLQPTHTTTNITHSCQIPYHLTNKASIPRIEKPTTGPELRPSQPRSCICRDMPTLPYPRRAPACSLESEQRHYLAQSRTLYSKRQNIWQASLKKICIPVTSQEKAS